MAYEDMASKWCKYINKDEKSPNSIKDMRQFVSSSIMFLDMTIGEWFQIGVIVLEV
jgi:hypothetical protein